jgi:flavin reductase (DIM6/NTAB) family NADH-FMN oxidoreductase RutF
MFYETVLNNHGLKYSPFKACVVPRPIAWISSISEAGVLNLAPYSYFNAINDVPPMIMYTSASKGESDKDSVSNIARTKEFVVNIVNFANAEKMNKTSTPIEYGISESELFDVEMAESNLIKVKRVKSACISMECSLVKIVDLSFDSHIVGTKMVIGHVLGIHIDDSVITDGMLDIKAMQVVARLGYDQYTKIDNVFSMPRIK